jgi:hypothetical protein
MTVLRQILEKYNTTTADGTVKGLREAMQKVGLAGLYRGGFLKKQPFTAALACGFFMGC